MERFHTYVALGDSISIDKYAGRAGLGAASLLYRNDDDVWPEFRGRDLVHSQPGVAFVMLADDGHTSMDVAHQLTELRARASSLRQAREGRALVSLSVGGNDLLALAASGMPTMAQGQAGLMAFSQRLERILDDVRDILADPRVLLCNVYDPTDGTGRMQSGRDVSAGLALLTHLNALLSHAASRVGAQLIDVHRHFLGHGMRHLDASYAHYHADDPSGWYVRDIEPNARGSSELRRLLLEALG